MKKVLLVCWRYFAGTQITFAQSEDEVKGNTGSKERLHSCDSGKG